MNASTVPCPHCGAEIGADATFCRHCGSSDSDGWQEDDIGDDGDEFDYEQFVKENFSTSQANTNVSPVWRLVAIILLLLFAFGYLLW